MTTRQTLKHRYQEFFFDHPKLKIATEYIVSLLVTLFSSFIFAFGVVAFINPINSGTEIPHIVSGGVSGLSQVTLCLLQLIGGDKIINDGNYQLAYSLAYLMFNIPICILAFVGIGKRFALFSIINVVGVFAFTNTLEYSAISPFLKSITEFVNDNGGLLARALFGGICTGISSAVAYKIDSSTGGVDVIAYYIGLKKSTLVGKYSIVINCCIVFVYAILSCSKLNWSVADGAYKTIAASLYSFIYMIVVMLLVDAVNLRNKKVEIDIVTTVPDLAKTLISKSHHGATVVTGVGAFSGNEKYIITTVISSYELKNMIETIKSCDPKAFVKVSELAAVYGNFFIKPVK